MKYHVDCDRNVDELSCSIQVLQDKLFREILDQDMQISVATFTFSTSGSAGRYMFADNGDMRPVPADIATMTIFCHFENTEYGWSAVPDPVVTFDVLTCCSSDDDDAAAAAAADNYSLL